MFATRGPYNMSVAPVHQFSLTLEVKSENGGWKGQPEPERERERKRE